MANITSELIPPHADHHEILWLLSQHYGGARGTEEGDVIYPNTSDSDLYSIKVRCKATRIVTVESGPAFLEDDLEQLKAEIEQKILLTDGQKIERCILFAGRAVKGSSGVISDALNILPAPEDAPNLPEGFWGDHPFVIEFPISTSSDKFLTIKRRMRAWVEWSWMLNALLYTTIRRIGPRSKQLWALPLKVGDTNNEIERSVQRVQEFYHIEGFITQKDSFTLSNHDPIPRIPADKYYGTTVLANDNFVLPDNFEHLVESFQNLDASGRQRFLQAAQWVYAANSVWDDHMSSSYNALVSAIESLNNQEAYRQDLCPTCGKDRSPGPTQRFQDFLEKYAPGPELEQNRKWLYWIRSDITHGRYVLQLDELPWGDSFNTTGLAQRSAYDQLLTTVRVVLVNWLEASAQAK